MKRILIIDDEAMMRNMLRQLLEREGYEVFDASDGDEGLKIQMQHPVELVITDLIMPEKEGLETITEFKKNYPDVKVIAMSGGGKIGPDNYLNLAEKFGAQRTLTKPFLMNELLEAVGQLLD